MADWLDEVERRIEAASPGPWYPHATDDAWFMNARYVGTEPGSGPRHDGLRGMEERGSEQVDGHTVIAITLLQSPRLADVGDDRWDENTDLIAHAPTDLRRLLAIARAAEDLAHWLQIHVDDSPTPCCYSEAALARYRAVAGGGAEQPA